LDAWIQAASTWPWLNTSVAWSWLARPPTRVTVTHPWPTRWAGCAALNTGWLRITWSPTAGWRCCRTLTNVEVPPRIISRIVTARVMFGPDALATAIPVPATTNAAEARRWWRPCRTGA
jgi:hypothetical protein